MTNYSQDEEDRVNDRLTRAKRNESKSSVEIGKDEKPQRVVDIEITDDDFRRVALHAHERDITINKMVGIILKDSLRSSEHIFELPQKQLLNEG
jgi:hypothetical protein